MWCAACRDRCSAPTACCSRPSCSLRSKVGWVGRLIMAGEASVQAGADWHKGKQRDGHRIPCPACWPIAYLGPPRCRILHVLCRTLRHLSCSCRRAVQRVRRTSLLPLCHCGLPLPSHFTPSFMQARGAACTAPPAPSWTAPRCRAATTSTPTAPPSRPAGKPCRLRRAACLCCAGCVPIPPSRQARLVALCKLFVGPYGCGHVPACVC